MSSLAKPAPQRIGDSAGFGSESVGIGVDADGGSVGATVAVVSGDGGFSELSGGEICDF